MLIIVALAKRIHLCIKRLTIISFPKRKQNAETFFQRELLLYVSLLIINFYEQFLKLNFQGNNLNLSLGLRKLTTTACFIQEESSDGKQFRKHVSCFYAQGGNVGVLSLK